MTDSERAMNQQQLAASNEVQWQRNNDAYLSAALQSLRTRLHRLASAPEPPAIEPESKPARTWFFQRREEERPRLALPPGDPSDAEIKRAAAQTAAAEDVEPPPALHILASRFGLSQFEREVLLLCAAIELDTRIAGLCAHAQQDPNRPYPTFALAMTLFDEPAWDVLSPERPLRYWRLIEINQPGAQALTSSPLRADERIVNYLKGLNYLDDRLTSLLTPFDSVAQQALPPSQEAARATVEQIFRLAADDGGSPLVQLVGADPLSKQIVAQRAARALNLNLYRLPVELLPQQAAELETLARLWQRESILLPVALFLDAHEYDGPAKSHDAGGPQVAAPLQRFLTRSRGVFLLSTREIRSGISPSIHAVEVEKPTPAEQQAAWAEAIGQDAGESPALLAGQFDLNASTIRQIVRNSQPGAPEGPIHDRLWKACLVSTGPRMDRLAQRLRPVATWDDIILPDEETDLLRQLAAQVAQRAQVYDQWGFRQRMNRGLGISALFVGESGTGKTMAAEVIANDLRLHLYRIDLSAVVSKYIGETEKNLRQLFDAAEDGGAILFFDEADALFGKRSEVRDSHDRYANIEVNYLLQRMEAYHGLAILATNMRNALDDAFTRRLRFVITFPFPGRVQRKAIWQHAWPAETPLAELDYNRLARLSLAGGNIANVALNAAFLAAERGSPVTMPLVLDAARAEYHKLERPINEGEFRWDEPRRRALAAAAHAEVSA
jgi:ATPase family associated with various cellular activities (AAA)/Winged helix domain, variant